jgi:hypothetical protein
VRDVDPAAAVGAFLGLFGVLVLVAIAFTETTRGQVTNLACGLVLLGIAAILMRTRWNPPPPPPGS